MIRTKTVAMLCFIALSSAPLRADVQEFETEHRQQWFDAVGVENITTIDFTGYPNNTNITTQYSAFGLTFDGLNFITLDVPSFADDWGLRIFDGNDLYFEDPINWIAADILGNITIELYANGQKIYSAHQLGHSGLGQFGGVISDEPFDRVRLLDMSDNLTVLDDLHFGPPIPAPSVLAPLVMFMCAGSRRRRQFTPG